MYKHSDSDVFYPKDLLYLNYQKCAELFESKDKIQKPKSQSFEAFNVIEINAGENSIKSASHRKQATKQTKSRFWLWNKIKSKLLSKKAAKPSSLWFDYCKNSTIHGVQYIVDSKLNFLERFAPVFFIKVFLVFNFLHFF